VCRRRVYEWTFLPLSSVWGFRNLSIHKWLCLLMGKATSVVVSMDGLGWAEKEWINTAGWLSCIRVWPHYIDGHPVMSWSSPEVALPPPVPVSSPRVVHDRIIIPGNDYFWNPDWNLHSWGLLYCDVVIHESIRPLSAQDEDSQCSPLRPLWEILVEHLGLKDFCQKAVQK
jgi:hypothetical protein